jgi:CRISPR-associated exonuclease Cas4
MLILYAGLVLLAVALLVLWAASRQRRASGLPSGRVITSDTGMWKKVEKPLYDPVSGLTGRPDYLVEENGALIPVEVKSGRAPALPHDSHLYQLAAYCLLVERTYNQRPPYGILRYRDKTFSIDYTPVLERELLALMDAMRAQERSSRRAKGEAPARSHHEPGRCARCGYRDICDQRL